VQEALFYYGLEKRGRFVEKGKVLGREKTNSWKGRREAEGLGWSARMLKRRRHLYGTD